MQRGKLYLSVHGVPKFWKWQSTVNHWERGDADVDVRIQATGYKLQKRIEKRQVGLSMEDVLKGSNMKVKEIVTWWKLMPHRKSMAPHANFTSTVCAKCSLTCEAIGADGESWNKFSTLYKQKKVEEYMATLHFEKYSEGKDAVATRQQFLAYCVNFAKILQHMGMITMKDLHECNMNAKELAKATDSYVSRYTGKGRKKVQALRIPPKVSLVIATEVVQNEGLWVDVTDEVNTARIHKLQPTTFNNFISASLMIDILYRQTFGE